MCSSTQYFFSKKMLQFVRSFIFAGLCVVFSIRNATGNRLLEPTTVTTPRLIREAGYPVEEHHVTTQDGYILTLYRIPYSPHIEKPIDGKPLPVVFLQHGLIASSSDWVAIGPPNALAYLLSDNGYDVWLGNSRGTRYSLGNVDKDYKYSSYWNFDWNEMGVYDLPAVFELLKNETGVEQLQYIGHSQGTTEFFVYCTTYPSSCLKNIKAAHLLAPVAFLAHLSLPAISILGAIFGQPDPAVNIIGSFNTAPSTELQHLVVKSLCNDNSIVQPLCVNTIETLYGQSDFLNKSMIPFLSVILPAGSSFKQVKHTIQNYNSKKFQQFDYGLIQNIAVYGSLTPPKYDLDKYSAPTYLYYSESDTLATAPDVLYLVTQLRKGIVRDLYRVPPTKFNHIDFVYGIGVRELLYNEILKNVQAHN